MGTYTKPCVIETKETNYYLRLKYKIIWTMVFSLTFYNTLAKDYYRSIVGMFALAKMYRNVCDSFWIISQRKFFRNIYAHNKFYIFIYLGPCIAYITAFILKYVEARKIWGR